jgi:formate hydrogenlyase transcriptional activator
MESTTQLHAELMLGENETQDRTGLFSSESVLEILQLILAGAPLEKVLTIIARLVDSRNDGTLCTIWLPGDYGRLLHCAAAPSIPGFCAHMGGMPIGPRAGSCGTAVYRREPVYVSDVLNDPVWEHHRHLLRPFGIRAVWSKPLFANDGELLGTFAIHYREVRTPSPLDLELIESASHIAGIAIERQRSEERLHLERERLRLLLEITNSITSKLDMRGLVETLSTDLLRVTQCDFCTLLLPDRDSHQLRVTILYNPEGRGAIRDGALVPLKGSTCGKAFVTGKKQHFDRLEDLRNDPATFGSVEGRRFYEQVLAEGLKSACEVPLIGRKGVVGVLGAFSRTESAFSAEEFAFLDQVSREVAIAVENALEFERAMEERVHEKKQRLYLEEEIRADFGEIVGESSALRNAMDLVSVVAPTDSSVLILGETGTGKELIARAIHQRSNRRDRAFVKLNCAAIPLGLLESELFGHERGAFTGAIAQKTGRFELANQGTLFLDEVGDIPLELQAKLLRVLQEQEFERLGSNRTRKVDVRIIAATHHDLPLMVKQSAFRDDLYYRLNVFPIAVPALRERTEDIPRLIRHFTALFAQQMNKKIDCVADETMEALTRYAWPGNIRELRNFVERAVILSPGSLLRAPIAELARFSAPDNAKVSMTGLEALERDHIIRALEQSKWVVGGPHGAAQRLGMKRTSLLYKIQKHQIVRPPSA